MLRTATPTSAEPSDTQQVTLRTGNIVARKVWLPKVLYNALPYFYLVSGIIAFFATLYIGAWFWILPHYLLFSAACIHLGVVIYRRRHPRHTSSADEG